MSDVLDRVPAEPAPAGGLVTVTHPPVLPIVTMVISAVSAVGLLAVAIRDGAGTTDEISGAAATAWAIGSVVGVLLYAWFGLLDAMQRSSGLYREPGWRPRTLATGLTVIGWLAGIGGALLVAEAVARR